MEKLPLFTDNKLLYTENLEEPTKKKQQQNCKTNKQVQQHCRTQDQCTNTNYISVQYPWTIQKNQENNSMSNSIKKCLGIKLTKEVQDYTLTATKHCWKKLEKI